MKERSLRGSWRIILSFQRAIMARKCVSESEILQRAMEGHSIQLFQGSLNCSGDLRMLEMPEPGSVLAWSRTCWREHLLQVTEQKGWATQALRNITCLRCLSELQYLVFSVRLWFFFGLITLWYTPIFLFGTRMFILYYCVLVGFQCIIKGEQAKHGQASRVTTI